MSWDGFRLFYFNVQACFPPLLTPLNTKPLEDGVSAASLKKIYHRYKIRMLMFNVGHNIEEKFKSNHIEWVFTGR